MEKGSGFNLRLMDAGEQIEQGIKRKRIPFGLAVMAVSNILHNHDDLCKHFINACDSFCVLSDEMEFINSLLKIVYAAEKDGLIDFEKTLSVLEELNKRFPVIDNNEDNYHSIDMDAAPFIPDGWEVKRHKKRGMFKFDPAKISFYLSEKQIKGSITGYSLRKELTSKPVMNANVLDYLLAHQELIPEDWKNKYVFFWGTIYRYSSGGLCVRYLCWNGSKWRWDGNWLAHDFYSAYPAVLAS